MRWSMSSCYTITHSVENTARQLVEFATHGWRDVDPLPQTRSPTSQYGRAIGFLRMCEAAPPAVPSSLSSFFRSYSSRCCCRLPYRAGRIFQTLQTKGYSQLSILTGMLAIPVTLGAAFTMVLIPRTMPAQFSC